ncbi:elongator complex protein 6 isoform X2 [Medicago truncatula]|uniref:elongator complex protein 6 isoform X2 n=1 Tax=Medicago truncatula TaxID=3880 RepID=UPI001967FC95|nr:elongator complex protein 6 isoform X2 [Medicago truncatula]
MVNSCLLKTLLIQALLSFFTISSNALSLLTLLHLLSSSHSLILSPTTIAFSEKLAVTWLLKEIIINSFSLTCLCCSFKVRKSDEGKPNHNGFAAVFEKIESVIKALPQDNMKFATIMIDDISFLQVAANGSSNDVLDFLHYCYTLTSEYGCAFIALDHKDIYLNEEKPAIILEMEYLADILVKAEPLATGLAKDVHGQLMVLHKQTQHGIAPVKIHNFHYKIKENSIECFYPGTKI